MEEGDEEKKVEEGLRMPAKDAHAVLTEKQEEHVFGPGNVDEEGEEEKEESFVDDEWGEDAASILSLGLLAHGGPDVGVEHVTAMRRTSSVAGHADL
jgi:hypothetical protein